MFGAKLDVGRREGLFFWTYPMFRGKLDIGAPEDDFGWGGTHCLVPALGRIFRLTLHLFLV